MARRARTDIAPPSTPLPAALADGGPEQHVVVAQLADDLLGLRMDDVVEIIRLPPLVHMPLAPRSLLGLANLRGAVLPVVGLRRLLGLPDVPPSPASRVVVVDGGAPVGFLVDRIDSLVAVPTERIEHDRAGAGRLDPDLLDGVVKGHEGENSIKILAPERLLREEFSQFGAASARPRANLAPKSAAAAMQAEPVRQAALLSFDLGNQEYALPVERVREIIPVPQHVSEVAGQETAVLGVVTLRDRLLPLVSLHALLGLSEDDERPQRRKVVVLSMGDASVGVLADRAREILRVDQACIEPAPALLTRGGGEADIESICRLDSGRRLVAVLSPDRLFRSDVMRRVLSDAGANDARTIPDSAGSAMSEEQFVIFRLGGQEYGLPIGAVIEIARPPGVVTRLPKAPKFIDGVVNLRGQVLPVIDLCRRLDLEPQQSGGLRRILVLSVGGGPTGFLVDGVSEVLKIAAEAISPAPDVVVEQMRLIGRVANLDTVGRMILLIDPARLLDRIEADVLAKFERARTSESLQSP